MDARLFRDRLIAADPDRSRLRAAVRATTASALAVAVLIAISHAVHGDTRATMIGAIIAANGAVLPADATRRGRLVTSLVMPIAAAIGLTAGAITTPNVVLRTALFAAVTFVAVLVRSSGTRGTALGTLGFLGFFFAQYLGIRLEQLPAVASGVLVAGLLAVVVRMLTAQRERVKLANTVFATRRAAACVLYDGARMLAGKGSFRASEGDLSLLNEAALVGEDIAARLPAEGEARARIFAIELATTRFLAAVERMVLESPVDAKEGATPPVPADARARVREATLQVREVLRGERDAAPAVEAIDHEVAQRVRLVLSALVVAATSPHLDEIPSSTVPPAQTPAKPSRAALVQVPIAVVIAFVIGNLVVPGRGYWAVIAAFVVFARAATLGVALVRAWHRVLGTVVGVGAGLVLAELLRGQERLELGAIFASIFVGYYALKRNYGVFVGAFSLLIAIVYGLTGQLTASLVEVRILETLVGAGSAVLVAAIVLPTRPAQAIADRGAAVLDAVADLVGATFHGTHDEALRALRSLDRKVQDLREAAQGLTVARLLGMAPQLADRVAAITSVAFQVRPLVQLAIGLPAEPPAAEQVTRRARELAARIRGTETKPRAPSPAPGARQENAPTEDWRTERTHRWLTRTTEALDALEKILAA